MNSCLAVTITSTTDTYQTAYPEVSEGVVQYISPIGCVVTYYDAGIPSSTTLIDCPTDITNIPEGCQLSGCCKTVCPTGDFALGLLPDLHLVNLLKDVILSIVFLGMLLLLN